jgi:hypothetical protein
MPTPTEIKQALVKAGFEIYQTRGDVVHVAERVRENLLMDSGIRVHATRPLIVFAVRAQRNDFPGETDEQLFDRARALSSIALARGFSERETRIVPVLDPGDSGRTLDTWCEVLFHKELDGIDDALDEVRFALGIEKLATRR